MIGKVKEMGSSLTTKLHKEILHNSNLKKKKKLELSNELKKLSSFND